MQELDEIVWARGLLFRKTIGTVILDGRKATLQDRPGHGRMLKILCRRDERMWKYLLGKERLRS